MRLVYTPAECREGCGDLPQCVCLDCGRFMCHGCAQVHRCCASLPLVQKARPSGPPVSYPDEQL